MAYDGIAVGSTVDAVPELITRIFERNGSDGAGLRSLRNHLVFVVADGTRVEEMRKKVVRRMALAELVKAEIQCCHPPKPPRKTIAKLPWSL